MIKGFDNADVLLVLLFFDLLCLTVATFGLTTTSTAERKAALENHSVRIPPACEHEAMLTDMLLHD